MPGNFKREDLRIIKTHKALMTALGALLRRQSFAKITVYDICAQALVSRTAFYMHFSDKYDLLERWLDDARAKLAGQFECYVSGKTELLICGIYKEHFTLISNLLCDADQELQGLLYRFLAPPVGLSDSEKSSNKLTPAHTALSHFLAGGLFNVIFWQVKNGRHASESDLQAMIDYLHRLVKAAIAWDASLQEGGRLYG